MRKGRRRVVVFSHFAANYRQDGKFLPPYSCRLTQNRNRHKAGIAMPGKTLYATKGRPIEKSFDMSA